MNIYEFNATNIPMGFRIRSFCVRFNWLEYLWKMNECIFSYTDAQPASQQASIVHIKLSCKFHHMYVALCYV